MPTQVLTQLTKAKMDHEVVIDGIILRIFNRNPSVYIMHDFTAFMEDLLKEFHSLVFTLDSLKTEPFTL